MDTEERLMYMFTAIHGEITGSCYTELELDGFGEITGINVMKDNCLCWAVSKLDILFDYMTINLGVKTNV